MSEFKYHDSLRITEKEPEWDPSIPFELRFEFGLKNLDISIVNGLRRSVFADVPTMSIGPDVGLDVAKNITVFNTQYLKDRFNMQPIHSPSLTLDRDLERTIIFRVADPDDITKPLTNTDDEDRHIFLSDLIVLEIQPSGKTGDGQKQPQQPQLDEAESAAASEFLAEANAQGALLQGDEATPAFQAERIQLDSGDVVKRLDPSDFFTYRGMYLATLKKGESLYAEMKPKIGVGKEHARWIAGVVSYRFRPRIGNLIDDPEYWKSGKYDPIKDRKDYPRAERDIAGIYGTPAEYDMFIEYNGHYRPTLVWLAAINALLAKLGRFVEGVTAYTPDREQVTDWLNVKASSDVPNLYRLLILDEDHTLGNIVFSHYLYALHQMVRQTTPDNFNEEIVRTLSHYRVPHPLENRLIIELRFPEWSSDTIRSAFANFLREGEDSHEEHSYSPTIRLLILVLQRVIATLSELQTEAETISEMAKRNEISYVQAPPLGQSAIKNPERIERAEIEQEIQAEERSIIGEQEEATDDEGE